jgi:transcriptional regulator with XRE-family HTH domain
MNEAKLKKTIGTNLQKARKARRYTQKEVAEKVGLTANYYATLEQGVAIASVETLYEIFAVLGVTASDIFPNRV